MLKHTSCGCKSKFDSATCNSNQKWNNNNFQYDCKTYCTFKKDYSLNPSIVVLSILSIVCI